MVETDKSFQDRLREADKVVHPVEKQWHYEIMTAAGYEAVTKEQTGFVRCYHYEHPKTGRCFKLNTGISADYWTDVETKKFGLWDDLKGHLSAIAG